MQETTKSNYGCNFLGTEKDRELYVGLLGGSPSWTGVSWGEDEGAMKARIGASKTWRKTARSVLKPSRWQR